MLREVKLRELIRLLEKLIREAIALHLQGLRQAGEPIPEPTAVGTTLVEVPAA